MRNILRFLGLVVLIVLIAAAVFFFMEEQNDNPLEEAGEEIENTIESIGDGQ